MARCSTFGYESYTQGILLPGRADVKQLSGQKVGHSALAWWVVSLEPISH